ncbi:FMN-binding protein [Candidatus Sumerlaeota bacterium]|nr:FMN-binding protein [Candidatus Sumerlaeota bacterium]
MKGKTKTRQRIFTILFMFGITFVFISGVSFAYLFTREKVAMNEALFLMRGALIAAGRTVPENPAELKTLYQKTVEEARTSEKREVYFRVKDPQTGDVSGYVFIEKGAGLWGAITLSIGVTPDMNSILGLYFLDQNETPGLGGRITESWFCDQFKGKMGPFTLVPEGTSSKKNEFDAITGATSTSNAVKNIINDTLEKARKILEEDKE